MRTREKLTRAPRIRQVRAKVTESDLLANQRQASPNKGDKHTPIRTIIFVRILEQDFLVLPRGLGGARAS